MGRHLEELKGRFINYEGLMNLSEYRYSGEDHSLIYQYIVCPLSTKICNILPRSIAPNVLTLLGLISSVVAYMIIAFYCPYFSEPAPSWVYFVSSALILIYLFLDAMDGIQARRTSSSSPMGEIFDHVCDSFSLTICGLLFSATIRLGPKFTFGVLLVLFVPFYFSHWDDFNTGKLIMARFGSSPTDLLAFLSIVLILTGSFGSDFWTYSLLGGKHYFGINYLVVVLIAIGALISLIRYTTHVVRHIKRTDPSPSWSNLTIQLLPFILFFLICFLWGTTSPYILVHYPHQFMLSMGLVNAYLLARIIVRRMTQEPAITFYFILSFLFVCFLTTLASTPYSWDHNLNKHKETFHVSIVYILLGVSFLQWVFFFAAVVHQLSVYLRLPIFTVKSSEPDLSFLLPQSRQTYYNSLMTPSSKHTPNETGEPNT